jgi:probable phosphoglycerate mutase
VTPDVRPSLWLVRHGETEWAAAGRHTSHTDIPLTDKGRAQAAGIRAKVVGHRFGLVLSSPMQRALETCRLAGYGNRVEILDDLREWDYGADEGRTTPEIRLERPGWSVWQDGPKGGEPIEQVAARADRVIARVRSGEADVLCFGHAHCLRVVAVRWVGLPATNGSLFALAPSTVSVLGWEREAAVIERWNEACG